jgi:hypothetical protein
MAIVDYLWRWFVGCLSNQNAALAVLICILVYQGSVGHDCPYAMPNLSAVCNPDRPRNSAQILLDETFSYNSR